MEKENIKKELEALSKILADLPKIEDKNVPIGYFEGLPDTTWNMISRGKKTASEDKTKVIPFLGKLIGIAASFALLFFIIKGVDLNKSESEIPVDTMVEFIINDLGDLDEDFLFELHAASSDMAELDDETLDYMLEEEIDMIDDKILETLY